MKPELNKYILKLNLLIILRDYYLQ